MVPKQDPVQTNSELKSILKTPSAEEKHDALFMREKATASQVSAVTKKTDFDPHKVGLQTL